jgi:hypothetical protein
MTDRVRTIRLTAAKVGELIALFRNHPRAPVGDHLSDDLFAAYESDRLRPDEIEWLDVHLESCPECAIEMERRLEEADEHAELIDAFTQMLQDDDQDIRLMAEEALDQVSPNTVSAVRALVERLRDDEDRGRILPIYHDWDGIVVVPGVDLPIAAEALPEWRVGGTADDRLKSRYRENDAGDLEVYLASNDPSREGTVITLRAGPWVKEVVLRRVRPSQVAAEVVISRAERAALPPDTNLAVDSSRQRHDDAGAGQTGRKKDDRHG